ncbi:MAG: glutamate racemase, partial [Lactobacillus iners]|nr:glutamate racemase [Lactobacillus iners]
AEFIGKDKKIVDPADQVAQYTFNVLKRDNLLAEKGGKHEYYTTGDPIKFMKIAQKWMHDPTLKAQHVE